MPPIRPRPTNNLNTNSRNNPALNRQVSKKWYNGRDLENLKKHNPDSLWKTLQHNGPLLAPAYKPLPRHIKLRYNGRDIGLSRKAEEVATFYGKMCEQDCAKQPLFKKNFFEDWRTYMSPSERCLITVLPKCDFGAINKYYKVLNATQRNTNSYSRDRVKAENKRVVDKHGSCTVDGREEKIGNFRIEPPGLFRGRGDHPKMGRVKKRIEAKDITINIGNRSKVPATVRGHQWKKVCHINTVAWLASWKENVSGGVKYIMLHSSSSHKSRQDWLKFEKARQLGKIVARIRQINRTDMLSNDLVRQQRAVALYLIDKLALRAGNEKDGGESADTVGCCSLRFEHVKLFPTKAHLRHVVDFNFPGKDSIRYVNSVPVDSAVYSALGRMMEGKRHGDALFNLISTSTLNKHLDSLMSGLTAKVFLTYNASLKLQQQLAIYMKGNYNATESRKLAIYNRANRDAAILCNHQRAVPAAFDGQMRKMRLKIADKKELKREAEKELKRTTRSGEPRTQARLKKRIVALNEQLIRLEDEAETKESNKQIALGTSKLNYLDPRISVAWCRKHGVPIDKVFNKSQREKFAWAIEMVNTRGSFVW